METQAHTFKQEIVTEDQVEVSPALALHLPALALHLPALALHLKATLRQVWQIARAVLRGYLTGQPIDESRPRKGCC